LGRREDRGARRGVPVRDRGSAERADVLRVVVCGRADAPDGRVAM